MNLRSRLRTEFGGAKPWLNHVLWKLWTRIGGFRRARSIDWSRVQRVVFVCSGNICRSAYAEAVARQGGLNSASLGLDAPDGDPAHPDINTLARERSVCLDTHRTTASASFAWQPGDLALCVDPSCLARLQAPDYVQTSLLALWVPHPSWRAHLQDPYGRDVDYMRRCLDLIDQAVSGVKARINRRIST